MSTSLNKYIAQTGLCSRRKADEWIEAGRVLLNGEIAKKGNRVEEGDTVEIDGKPLKNKPKTVYLALNKPAGITCTTDRRDKNNIIDFLDFPQRIFPIGRLDKDSTGLILLTNDGDIVNGILRAEHGHEKEYIVDVNKPIGELFLQKMRNGIPILGRTTNRCKVTQLGDKTFSIILTQGMNRQIRRMCEYLAYNVVALKRVRIMHIELGNLPEGHWRELTAKELQELNRRTKH